jgi:hypothetical protein
MDDFKEIKDIMMSSMTKASPNEDVTMIDTTTTQNIAVEQE